MTDVPEPEADEQPIEANSDESSSRVESGPDAAQPANADNPADDAKTDGEAEKLVPVTEAIRYRRRAQQAEQQLADSQQQLQSLQSRLDEAESTIQQLERRQKIDATLATAEPIDADAVRLLTEQAIQQMDEPDVDAAVNELRQSRPYLFRQKTARRGPAMAARVDDEPAPESERAADDAAMTGDRRDLLRYLRLRRRG